MIYRTGPRTGVPRGSEGTQTGGEVRTVPLNAREKLKYRMVFDYAECSVGPDSPAAMDTSHGIMNCRRNPKLSELLNTEKKLLRRVMCRF